MIQWEKFFAILLSRRNAERRDCFLGHEQLIDIGLTFSSQTFFPLLFLDPFAVSTGNEDSQGLVHIRIQQRNGRKTLTTVQGLSASYDLKKIVRSCKKVGGILISSSISPHDSTWNLNIVFVGIRLQRNCNRTSRVRRSLAASGRPTREYLPILDKDGIGEAGSTESPRLLNPVQQQHQTFFFVNSAKTIIISPLLFDFTIKHRHLNIYCIHMWTGKAFGEPIDEKKHRRSKIIEREISIHHPQKTQNNFVSRRI